MDTSLPLIWSFYFSKLLSRTHLPNLTQWSFLSGFKILFIRIYFSLLSLKMISFFVSQEVIKTQKHYYFNEEHKVSLSFSSPHTRQSINIPYLFLSLRPSRAIPRVLNLESRTHILLIFRRESTSEDNKHRNTTFQKKKNTMSATK